MKIIGFNLEKTHYGLPLDNGGACLIVDGEVKMLINEERINRKQYSAGFKESIKYILNANNLTVDEIDFWVSSSCLEEKRKPDYVAKQLLDNGFKVSSNKILVNGHHLGHAYSAYYPSGFKEAIIMVLDGDGNMIGSSSEEITPKDYWKHNYEHNSYFVAKGNEISFLEDDNTKVGENGFGGAYRYFTFFCGFPGYKYAGKLMGLSAYGSVRNKYKDIKVFDLYENGVVKCNLKNDEHGESSKAVEKWLESQGVYVKALNKGEEINEDIEDVAFLIQRELDRALLHKVKYLVKKTGIKNLCIAGGVGLNAVTNRYLLDNAGLDNIFIQPASGDSGQCLGNAYFGTHQMDKENIKRGEVSVYQGKEYSDDEIFKALEGKKEYLTFKKLPFEKLAVQTAKEIAKDKIIGWFQGRSEMGPRALGNRSLLADPRDKHMKDILNLRVKHREYFRPFAPSILEDQAKKWFDCPVVMPYMIMNANVLKLTKLGAVTHYDGSARVQTVNKNQNYRYYRVIEEFSKISGVPVVIDTSFNDNEAIVETPAHALDTYLRTGIDILVIGDYFVTKKKGAQSKIAELDKIVNGWTKELDKEGKIQEIKNKVLNKIVVNLVKKYYKKGWVFDYHSEWGELANEIAKLDYTVQAMNTSDSRVLSARKMFKKPIFFTEKEFNEIAPSLKNKFDVVVSNLWFSMVSGEQESKLLNNYKKLMNVSGKLIITMGHPCFTDDKESLVTRREIPKNFKYTKESKITKIVHENGLQFIDNHRPLSYYTNLFEKNGFIINVIKESDTLNTRMNPDFIIFVLSRK